MRRSVAFPCGMRGLALLVLLCLVLAARPARSMIDNDQSLSCASDDTFFSGWAFQYAKGGQYTLVSLTLLPGDSWQHRNHSVQVILATDTQLDPIRPMSMSEVCNTLPEVTWSTKLGGSPSGPTTARYFLPSTEADWYRLLVLNCDGDSFDMRFSDVAVNPNGEYLSLSEVPYKPLYRVFIGIWCVMIALWLLHLFLYRHWNVALQLALTALPLSKAIVCIPTLLFWLRASSTGSYPRSFAWGVLLTETLERMVWVGLAYLLACGWRITIRSPPAVTQRLVLGLLGMLGLSYLVYSLMGGFLVFLMLIAYVLLLRVIFASLVESGNLMLRQLHVLQRADIDYTLLQPLVSKMFLFKHVQLAVLIYLSINVIFQLWAAIFLRSTPYVGDAADQALSSALVIAMFAAYRMRPFNPFYAHVMLAKLGANANAAQEDAGAVAAAAAAAGAGAEGQRNNDAAAAVAGPAGAFHGRGGGGEQGDSYQSLPETPSASASAPPHSIAVYARASESPDVLYSSALRNARSDDDDEDDGEGAGFASARGASSSSICAWRSVGPDGLWRPGCPVPPMHLCMPSAVALGPEHARAEERERGQSGGGGARAADHESEEEELLPVLVLENDDDASPAPLLLGTLLPDPVDSAASSSLAADAALLAESGRGNGGVTVAGGAFGVSGNIPAAALPYMPRSLRAQAVQQERMLQSDARALDAAAVGIPSSARGLPPPAAESNRSAPRRRAEFPAYL